MNTAKHILVIGTLLASSALAYERLQGPTELLFCNKEKALNGYTLFGVGNRTFLLDLDGRAVHKWPVGTNPHLLDNGNIVDASKDDPSGFPGFKEVDWDGKTVWEYTEKRENYAPHHDWVRIFNKQLNAPTTLYIANKTISYDQAVAAGADPKKASTEGGQMDAVVEVDMQGKVLWEWGFFDHVVQDIDPAKPNYVGAGKTVADHPGRINLNLPGRPLKRDWLHCNSLDYSPESGHIVINSVQGELYVVDHDGTFVAGDPKASIAKAASSAGDFLYRFGDPARYAQGDPPRVLENWDNATTGHKQMGGPQHSPRLEGPIEVQVNLRTGVAVVPGIPAVAIAITFRAGVAVEIVGRGGEPEGVPLQTDQGRLRRFEGKRHARIVNVFRPNQIHQPERAMVGREQRFKSAVVVVAGISVAGEEVVAQAQTRRSPSLLPRVAAAGHDGGGCLFQTCAADFDVAKLTRSFERIVPTVQGVGK